MCPSSQINLVSGDYDEQVTLERSNFYEVHQTTYESIQWDHNDHGNLEVYDQMSDHIGVSYMHRCTLAGLGYISEILWFSAP